MMDKTHDLEAAAEEGGRKWLAAEGRAMTENVEQLVEKARDAVEELSNTHMSLTLEDWCKVSADLLAPLDTIASLQAQLEKANQWAKEQHACADRYAAQLDKAREALKPFARFADVPARYGDERIVSAEMPMSPHEKVPDKNGVTPLALCVSLDGLNVGHFRKARAALTGEQS